MLLLKFNTLFIGKINPTKLYIWISIPKMLNVTFINLIGERESKTYNSEVFKDKIIEYLKKKGYILIYDSFEDGTLPDLILRNPFIDNNCEIRAEVKYQDLSLTDKPFLSEVGRNFLAYMKLEPLKRFYFYIFIRRCKNVTKWKKVFDENISTIFEINNFRDDISKVLINSSKTQFDSHSFEDFYNFINNTKVWQTNYETLLMRIENHPENKFDVLNFEQFDSTEPKKENENLLGNLIKIIKFPQVIFISKILKMDKDLFFIGINTLYYPYGKQLYSLKPQASFKRVIGYLRNYR